MDYRYRVVPADSALLRIAPERQYFGDYLCLYGLKEPDEYLQKRGNEEEDVAEYLALTAGIRAAYPGIEELVLDIDRRWDMLLYLLYDARRFDSAQDPNHPAYLAVNGGDAIGQSVTSGIGIPIRYLTPEQVKEVFVWLGAQDETILRSRWDAGQMANEGVYKIHPEEGDYMLDYVIDDFHDLSDLFAKAAMDNHSIITCCI